MRITDDQIIKLACETGEQGDGDWRGFLEIREMILNGCHEMEQVLIAQQSQFYFKCRGAAASKHEQRMKACLCELILYGWIPHDAIVEAQMIFWRHVSPKNPEGARARHSGIWFK